MSKSIHSFIPMTLVEIIETRFPLHVVVAYGQFRDAFYWMEQRHGEPAWVTMQDGFVNEKGEWAVAVGEYAAFFFPEATREMVEFKMRFG